jgi:L-ascorbate metabolism protein UlaG (beta-lactamase superfamily)
MPLMTYPISDHFDGTHFFNPEPTNRTPPPGTKPRRGILSFIIARLRRDPNTWSPWPDHIDNKPYPAPTGDTPAITFIGHSSFLLRLAGLNVLTDPVFAARCSPTQLAGPKRVRAPGIALENLPPIDLILLSHNHYDHMDLISLRKIHRKNPSVKIVTSLGNTAYLAKKGLPGVVELDWWQSHTHGESKITATPARHFAARGLYDRNETLWCGFMLEHGGQKIYVAGDTGYTKFFKDIRARLGAPDLALLPIGAYEPRWFMGPVHMNPADAVQAFQDLEPRLAIGKHFGTFQLTAEPYDAPLKDLATAKSAANIPTEAFTTLDIGESRPLPRHGRA